MRKFKFFYEGQADKPEFTIYADSVWEAFNKATESFGPWAEDLMYQEVIIKNENK